MTPPEADTPSGNAANAQSEPGPAAEASSVSYSSAPSSSAPAVSAPAVSTPAVSAPAAASATPSSEQRSLLSDVAIRRALMRIAHEIVERHEDLSQVYLVAIPNGGVPLARILVENLKVVAGTSVPLGILDTTLYRDDVISSGARPLLRVTEMPSSVDERAIVLVEDVVNTGRTIRAAMDALMDFGRPRVVQVVALVDRGQRELPIRIDYVGKNIPTQPGETVRLCFGEPPGAFEPESAAEGRDPWRHVDGPLEVVLERPASEG